MTQRRLSVREILQGLQAGGLKPNKYRNVYSILRGREAYQADITYDADGFVTLYQDYLQRVT